MLLLVTCLCQAQEVRTNIAQHPKKTPKTAKVRPVKVIYYMAPKNAPKMAHLYVAKKEVAKTPLPTQNFSDTFSIPKGDLQIHFSPKTLAEDQLPSPQLPTIHVPKSWKKILLVVFHHPKNKAMPIRVKAINASDNHFPTGSTYILNLSKIGVKGTIGKKEILIKPRSHLILKNAIAGNGYYPVNLQSYVQGETRPRRFIKQMWQKSDQVRNVLFILPKPAPLHATYYTAPIRDF